jgi:competence/damage-inducible protein CinA-like protein
MNVDLINIGNELLLGIVTNTHAAYLGQKLAELGFHLERQVTVADDPAQIAAALREALERADIVMMTGGLGPTSDDMTASVVGKFFNLRFRIDQKVQKANEEWFKKRGVPMPELVKHQALVPEGSIVLYNEHGTAPGFILSISGKRTKWLIVLPGPPRELKPMFEKDVVAFIREKFPGQSPVEWRVLRIAELGESVVQERVEKKMKEEFPGLEVAYCARPGEVDLRLSGPKDLVERAESVARKILGLHVFGEGSAEIEMEATVIRLLRERKKTVTCAESCTGGALANRFTNIPGSSEVFLGGWVAYSNDFKMRELGVSAEVIKKDGAVSEAVAREMAEAARKKSGADFTLSITGIAGPNGGTAEKPPGTVFIALAAKEKTEVWREFFPVDRWTFKWRVAQHALNRLRLELLKKETHD